MHNSTSFFINNLQNGRARSIRLVTSKFRLYRYQAIKCHKKWMQGSCKYIYIYIYYIWIYINMIFIYVMNTLWMAVPYQIYDECTSHMLLEQVNFYFYQMWPDKGASCYLLPRSMCISITIFYWVETALPTVHCKCGIIAINYNNNDSSVIVWGWPLTYYITSPDFHQLSKLCRTRWYISTVYIC